MVSIPLYIFLFIYLLFLAVFAIFMFINLYHLVASGSLTLTSFFVTFFLLAFAFLVLYSTWQLIQSVDWRTPVAIFSRSWFGGGF